MKTMYTPAEFAAEVERRADAAVDVVAPSSAIRVHTNDDGVSRITIDGVDGEYGILDQAHAQIAARLQIPLPYYRRMQSSQPALLDANIATWLNATDERRLLRFLDDKLRAYVSDKYQRIDYLQVLRAISPIIEELQDGSGARIISCGLSDQKMWLKVIVPGIEAEIPVPGGDGTHAFRDVYWPGFVVEDSETGHGTYRVSQMVFRRVCSNGMIVGDTLSKRHVGGRITDDSVFSDRTRQLDDATILSATQDIVRAAVDETKFHNIVRAFGEAHETAPSVDPVKTVEILAKSHDLGEGEATKVLTAFTLDAGANGLGLFGLVNAVTRASQSVEDYERATEMEKLGGDLLLNTSDREWLRLAGVAA